jgi:hypothetical protein
LEVTTNLERCPVVPGVRVHRSGRLGDDATKIMRGIALTTTDRTIADLSSRLSISDLGRMTDEAVRRKLTSLARISETAHLLGKAPGRSPRKVQRMLMRRLPGGEVRESELEDFVFDALRRFGLPLPTLQYRVIINGARRRIDLCYVDRRLAIEALGFNFHGLRSRFDEDAARGNELVLAGYRVLAFTSAFTQWMIAEEVARALEIAVPPRPKTGVTFHDWLALR